MTDSAEEISQRLKSRNPFEINCTDILTAQEHRIIGSTPPYNYENAFIPISLGRLGFDQIRELRREQGAILSQIAGLHLGIKDYIDRAAVIMLSDINAETGEVEEKEPKLITIYDERSDSCETDPEQLAKYELTEEGRSRFFLETRSLLVHSEREF